MDGDNRTFRVNFTSEGVSRLRDVVEEKLKEFMGDYTDDTLVEYVIVLLKNGRSKDEAKSELNVFLGDDSDSFVSWLWDHLGSNLSLYVQPQELHSDGAPKSKLTTGVEAGKTETHQIESETGTGNYVKGHHNNQECKDLVRDGDENKIPLPRKSVADKKISQDEPHQRVVRTKPSLSPRPTIHKKRRQTEEQHPRKKWQKEVSRSDVGAPRRLLQFAVRDAVATSRPNNATAEPSRKRLRSVVSTSTGDLLQEERPQRIQHTLLSAAIKAAAEAVEDVSKLRPSHNVFNRLGRATDVSNTTYNQEHGHVAEDVGDGDFGVGVEKFDSVYHPQNDGSMLHEENMSPFHDTVLDSVLGYDGDDYDDIDGREQDNADVSWFDTSDRNWVENSLTFQYETASDNVDEKLRGPGKDLGPPAARHNASVRIAASVIMNTRKSQYQEARDVSEMNNRKGVVGSAVATKSDVRLLKENNNPMLAFKGNAKPDTTQQQPEKTQTPTANNVTGPPTEDADSRTIFVSNVHFAATNDSLSRHFNKFGEVLKVTILTDSASGQPKGSAYIEFMRKEAAELTLSLDGTSFMSRLLKIVRKSSAQPEAGSITAWPRIARASPFPVPRFGRVPFARGTLNIYRARGPIKPGGRSFQWKRGAVSSATEASTQAYTNIFPTPTIRGGLTYVRTESKTNGSSGTA
ncbi:hypothetical protein OROGR_004016 [Orobanche gracilis]